jgi:hypothetical protein
MWLHYCNSNEKNNNQKSSSNSTQSKGTGSIIKGPHHTPLRSFKSLSFQEETSTIVKPSSREEHMRRHSVVGKDFSTGSSASR